RPCLFLLVILTLSEAEGEESPHLLLLALLFVIPQRNFGRLFGYHPITNCMLVAEDATVQLLYTGSRTRRRSDHANPFTSDNTACLLRLCNWCAKHNIRRCIEATTASKQLHVYK